jgi:WD40 repeat protein
MNHPTQVRPSAAPRILALALMSAVILSACAGGGSSFGMTRAASNEGRRALDIECAGDFVFSPDGRYMASSNGRRLRVRESPSGRPHETLEIWNSGDANTGTSLAFSPDGRWLASSARGDSAVMVFDTAEWKEHAKYLLELGRVGAIAFSRDGSELAIGSTSSMIELCTVASGARRVLRKPHTRADQQPAPISFLAYGDGDRTLLANAGGDVIDIDRAQGDILWSRSEERILAVSADAQRLISVSTVTGLPLLVGVSGDSEPAVLCTIHDPAAPSVASSAVFAADGSWIGVGFRRDFLGTNWQELEFYRVLPASLGKATADGAGETMRAEQIRSLRAGEPRRITVSPDGKLLCLCLIPIAGIYELGYLLPRRDM